MIRDLQIMGQIQEEKKKEIRREQQMELNAEGKRLAKEKRFTFDVIDTPVDPLR